MRRVPQLTLFFFFIAVTIFMACQREVSLQPSNGAFDAAAAKEWWYGNYRKTEEYNRTDWNSLLAPAASTSAKKYPGWRKALSYKKSGFDVVELPLYYESSRVLLPGMQQLYNTAEGFRIAKSVTHKLLIIQKGDKSKIVRTCTIIPSQEYARKSGYDISHINLQNIPTDFEGFFLISAWDTKFINLLKVKNGRPVKKINLLSKYQVESKAKTLGRTDDQVCPPGIWVPELDWVCAIVPTGDDVADREHCQEIGHWAETGEAIYEVPDCYEEGDGGFDILQDCLDSGSSEDCYCMIFGIGCPLDPSGNPILPDLQNNVDDPCLRNSVDNAIALDCRNKITAFINTVYPNNDYYHLFFEDNTLVGNLASSDAYTVAAPLNSLSAVKTTITLNNGQLGNATREYIAATILHEAIHAWIDYQYPTPQQAAQQHSLMASTDRFNTMVNALREMFPNLSLQDAIDLTWGGLYSTPAFQALPSVERERIRERNDDFKQHRNNTGTPC